jgi:hypothetical protein
VGPQSITKHSRSFSRKLLSPFSDQTRKVVEIAEGYVTFAIHCLLSTNPVISSPFKTSHETGGVGPQSITKHSRSFSRKLLLPFSDQTRKVVEIAEGYVTFAIHKLLSTNFLIQLLVTNWGS